MAQLMLINPRKRRTRRAKVSANPKRRVHRRSVAHTASRHVSRRRVHRNPMHAMRHHRRRVRRNPIGGGGIGAQVMDAAIGGAGAVLVDVVTGYLPIPSSLATGYGPYLVKGALGLGMGMFRNRTLKRMGAGALLVAAYGAIKTATSGMLPAPATVMAAPPSVAGLGYYSPTPVLGEYVTGPQARMHGMGEFVSRGDQFNAGSFGHW